MVAEFIERCRYVHWWFTVGSRFVSRTLLSHRVVKPMKYFADIEAVCRIVAIPGLSFSSLLVRL